jgi:predicted N-formylglutamate amidohydrolase
MSGSALLISCEHGGNTVPPPYGRLFDGWRDILDSHRGYDPGALTLARALAEAMAVPLFATTVSRLLVDCNRSLGHPGLFSERTKALPRPERQAILDTYYHPHRDAVTRAVAERLDTGATVLHLACHSFTPCLDGVTRHCDVGFLYDPGKEAEKAFCLAWRRALASLDRTRILRRNAPYKGAADGLTTSLRRRFGPRYLGVELEVNQRFAREAPADLARLTRDLIASLARVLGDLPSVILERRQPACSALKTG